MEEILMVLLTLFLLYFTDQVLFRIEEKKLCKKNKGNCSNCKAWSCYKGNLEYKKIKEMEKNNPNYIYNEDNDYHIAQNFYNAIYLKNKIVKNVKRKFKK